MDKPDRAVVAISEDRAIRAVSEGGEYEVVLTAQAGWLIIKKVKNGWITAGPNIQDTGQDAREVLEKFLEGRDGTTPDSDYPLRDLPTDRAEADDVHPGAGAGTGQ